MLARVSTAAVVGVIVWGVPQLSGWERVRQTFFDRDTFSKTFRPILHAFLLDLRIFVVCAPLIVIWGLCIALARGVR